MAQAVGGAGQESEALRVAGRLENRFLLSAIAFQRTRQLREGAKARVESAGHKSTYLAVLEVLANTISWSRE